MRISKIKALCAAREAAYIFHMPGGQMMLSDGTAAYDTEGMVITEADVKTLFDLSEEKAKGWSIGTPDYSEVFAEEGEELDVRPVTVAMGGTVYMVLEEENGNIWLIGEKKADACRGKAEYRKFWLDRRPGGDAIIRVTDGIDEFPAAYIMPETGGVAGTVLGAMREICTGENGAEMQELTDDETRMPEEEQLSVMGGDEP